MICVSEVERAKVISQESQDAIIRSALFVSRMEGFRVPASVVRDGRRVLEGKVTADELVQRHKSRYCRNQLMDEYFSEEALKRYQVHPKHVEVGKFISSVRLDRAVVDYRV